MWVWCSCFKCGDGINGYVMVWMFFCVRIVMVKGCFGFFS